MNLDDFWKLVLTSSFISTILTNMVNYFLKSVDYENKYREEVLKRRFEAYKDLGESLAYLKVKTINIPDGWYAHSFLADTEQYFHESTAGFLLMVGTHDLWVGKETREALHTFRDYLYNFRHKHRPFSSESKQQPYPTLLGKEHFEEIQGYLNTIEKSMLKDLATIKDVKYFLKERGS